jgi:protein phosphatase
VEGTIRDTFDDADSSLEIGDEARLFGNSQGRLLLVADGMGGHAVGDRASEMVVRAFADYVLNMLRWYFRADPSHDDELAVDLRDAMLRCQRSIREEVGEHPEQRGMGSTLTLAYVIWPRMFVVHVGDSRCYLMREGTLKQLTRDHSVAQRLVEEQTLSPAEAEESRWNHVLWNAVGGSADEPQPDIFRVDLEFDDRLLVCTDGLTKHVSDPELSARLQQERPAFEICRQLIDDANAAGGTDNITAIVARFPKPRLVGGEESAAAAVQAPRDAPPAEVPMSEPLRSAVAV